MNYDKAKAIDVPRSIIGPMQSRQEFHGDRSQIQRWTNGTDCNTTTQRTFDNDFPLLRPIVSLRPVMTGAGATTVGELAFFLTQIVHHCNFHLGISLGI
ncbi:hypothetical protein A2U01_0002411 [Trifolium medium]|uniref:Uncharacterized protein n=1 Tax=Trifolium medium TaxID=97028 RepID=A0A392M2U5_9FABA|nr:hypothetical protein [Trifolium medium]